MGSDDAFAWIDDARRRSQLIAVMRHLGRQLETAAGLTKAFEAGYRASSCGNCDFDYHDAKWTPGCGATTAEIDAANREADDRAQHNFDCNCCGLRFDYPADKRYDDGEPLECRDCHAQSIITIDEDDGARIGHYVCRHGLHDDEPCEPCETAAGVP